MSKVSVTIPVDAIDFECAFLCLPILRNTNMTIGSVELLRELTDVLPMMIFRTNGPLI
jgi:hypothetical protein